MKGHSHLEGIPPMAAHASTGLLLDPRSPRPERRLDLYAALAVTAVASLVYVLALLLDVVPPRGLAVAFVAAAPICAGFALIVLVPRARAEGDTAVAWFTAGLTVGWLAMLLHLVSFPAVARNGGVLGTDGQSSSALYLLFHLAPALGAVAGAVALPGRWRVPAAVVGGVLALLVAVNVVPLPMLLNRAEFSRLLIGLEYGLFALIVTAAFVWVRRVGREATALRGWIGVSLSLAAYEVLLNAFAAERFTPVWWASLSLRVATYAVLAVGATVTVLSRLRETESYSDAELDRREEQLRASLRLTSELLASAEDLARAVTPLEVGEALCLDAVGASGLPHASLLVTSPGEGLVLLGSVGYDSRMRAEVIDIGWETQHPGPRALIRGEPVFLYRQDDIRAQFPAVSRTPLRNAGTMAALPIRVGPDLIGTLIVWDARERRLDLTERKLLVGIAAQGGQALRRAQAYENEATAAATLQTSLLSGALPRRAELVMAARYVAGERGLRVGGDWYDCVVVDDRSVALVIGDIMGKGLRAASVMGEMRTAVRSLAGADPAPSTVLAGLDKMTSTLDPDEIATVAYVLLDLAEGTALVSRAGHLPPILVEPDGAARFLEGGDSPPLGWPVESRPQDAVPVRPGSLLVLYTDGIVEERRTGLDGLDTFLDVVAETAGRHGEDLETMAGELLTRSAVAAREDDVALLVARYLGT